MAKCPKQEKWKNPSVFESFNYNLPWEILWASPSCSFTHMPPLCARPRWYSPTYTNSLIPSIHTAHCRLLLSFFICIVVSSSGLSSHRTQKHIKNLKTKLTLVNHFILLFETSRQITVARWHIAVQSVIGLRSTPSRGIKKAIIWSINTFPKFSWEIHAFFSYVFNHLSNF